MQLFSTISATIFLLGSLNANFVENAITKTSSDARLAAIRANPESARVQNPNPNHMERIAVRNHAVERQEQEQVEAARRALRARRRAKSFGLEEERDST